jgi:hypothetical protein
MPQAANVEPIFRRTIVVISPFDAMVKAYVVTAIEPSRACRRRILFFFLSNLWLA